MPLLAMEGIVKRFGEVTALAGVDFRAERGEIHGLLGENGAGKTTLMNVLSGLYRPDAGRILLDGQPAAIREPRDAVARGVAMVHQHVELVGHFTALENIVLGREGGGWRLRRSALRGQVEALAARYGLAVPLDVPVARLGVGVQQKVEILKALYRGVEILILDEPTTLLTPQEVETLFATLGALTRGGLLVIFITHKIREALAVTDRLTVMRRGRVVATLPTAAADEGRLVELMIGERLPRAADATVAAALGLAGEEPAPERHPAPAPAPAPAPPAAPGPTTPPPSGAATSRAGPAGATVPRLALEGLTVGDERGRAMVEDVSLVVHAGEIVGVAGVAGNGQRELVEAIVGLRPARRGRILLDGSPIEALPGRERLARGIAYIPEDRLGDGILPTLSVTDSLLLGLHHLPFRGVRLDARRARALAEEVIAEYRIVCPDPAVRTATLSGGNIQRVVAGRAFRLAALTGHRLLVAMNPARGLDVPATRLIHERLREVRARGGAVLLCSEDLDELMTLADRIAVLRAGRLAGLFTRDAYDPYAIGAAMVGAAGAAGG
ncbi:MAG: ABC transporter ATP-binding protein [Armatimonadota bacterium]|nr:ABC transporter ATP-binding protein [Armatimonadota bacterium]